MNKNKKIFLGLEDISSFISDWSEGFQALGFTTLKGISYKQAIINNSKVDFVIQDLKDKIGYFKPGRISVKFKPWWDQKAEEFYLRKAMRQCDVFIFFWRTFYPDYADLKILKENGKKIVVVFVGSDIRWYNAMQQQLADAGLEVDMTEFKELSHDNFLLKTRLQYLRMVEKYADVIFSHPSMSQFALRPYYNIDIPVKLSEYLHRPIQRNIPVIVHAPTRWIKGTKYIQPVIDKLKIEGYNFEYKFITDKPRAEALRIYEDADIILDQLLIPGGGKLAHEGLAMGKVVLSFMAYDNLGHKKSNQCPVVDVNKQNLYEVLKKLIPEQGERQQIANKGRQYIQDFHDPAIICKKVITLLKDDNKLFEPDFNPEFFRKRFEADSGDELLLINDWTMTVKECDWYNFPEKNTSRNGLLF